MSDSTTSPYAITTVDDQISGARCTRCTTATAPPTHRCPGCGGPMLPSGFVRVGRVFSATQVWIPVGGREPPTVLAYIDLDDGPRLLGQWQGEPPRSGARARVDVVDGVVRAKEEG